MAPDHVCVLARCGRWCIPTVVRLRVFLAALVLATAGAARGGESARVISGRGIAGVRFGIPQQQAVARLSALLGRPSRRFVNSGCGPRYTEIAWGRLYVEFRLGRFSGFRYIENGWPPSRFGTKATPSLLPRLSTAEGITLGSTLGGLRAAYGRLTLVGTDLWKTKDGLVFYDNAKRDPPPQGSRIVEIKTGTCGDF
jgi:hypothetical protein